jgi:His-Xaa-Ser system radical SAM maturase HxsB
MQLADTQAPERRPIFEEASKFEGARPYRLLPFRFTRLPGSERLLLVSEVGEHIFLPRPELEALVAGRLGPEHPAFLDLEAKQFLTKTDDSAAVRLLAAKYRTRKSFLRGGPSLHIFVVTLRCDHSCAYCQVSRQISTKHEFDMSDAVARAAVDRLFEAPAPVLTVEFQGGEPLLNFERIKSITDDVSEPAAATRRSVRFTIVSTLHHLDEEMLRFFKHHNFHISTSLDGPAWLHDRNRPAPGGAAAARTLEGVRRVRDALGHEAVAALTTITRESLAHPEAIVDAYVESGFSSIFLRPMSPYGFAVRSARRTAYRMNDFVEFYRRALDHILRLARTGVAIQEAYASILLTHILTPFPTGYVDLRSPAGAGLGALVYNYEGGVYASDEARMLAEMGDDTFRLGDVRQRYAELMSSPAMAVLMNAGVAESLPGCADCAFLPFCGGDPIHTYGQQGDPVGHRAKSDHCRRHTGLFQLLFDYLADGDPETLRILTSWATPWSQAPMSLQ